MRSIGKGVRELKRGMKDIGVDDEPKDEKKP
jgi:Sec-independent protein translocase protein TatA